MRYQAKAVELLNHPEADSKPHLLQESARMSNTAARLMGSFQEAIQTLARMRQRANQTMEIRHVTVQAGAQAMIGNVQHGGPARPRGRRKQ
jgi:hypothetical protein